MHLFKIDVFFLIRPKRILGLCYVVVKVSNLIIETLHFCGLFVILFKPMISLNFHRVLKWWHHKNQISEIVGFVRIFWNNSVQEAYLPKISISRQFFSEILAQLFSDNSKTLLNFFGVDKMLVFGRCSFRISDKSHNFRNIIFMTSHFRTLLQFNRDGTLCVHCPL